MTRANKKDTFETKSPASKLFPNVINETNLIIGIKPPYVIDDLKDKTIEIAEFKELFRIDYIKFI